MPDPSATEFYTELNDIQIDPYIRNVFGKIEEYKDLIAGEFISSEEINGIMNALDDEWRMLLGREASFTGVASFLPVDAEGVEGSLERSFFEDETIRFNGVMPQQLESEHRYVEETDSYEEYHTYNLRLQVWRESLDNNGKIVHLKGVAEVADVLSLEFPDVLSVAGAKKWLAYYHPEDIDYVDIDLYADGREECEVALRLAEHSVDLVTPYESDDKMVLRSMIALNVYTNSLISFDPSAPYVLTVDGEAWFPTSQGTMEPGYAGGTQMAAIEKIAWLQPVGESRQILTPHLHTRLLNETKDTPDTHVVIPVSAIKRLRSSRFEYFYGYDQDPGDAKPGK